MTVFKCKMCGASLDVETTAGVVQCEYCGSKQTLPNLDDERRASMYDRANHFRRNNEFDKAAAIFEQILNDDNTDAEAYWSLVLCKYGVEYVEDPATRKRLPTIHRAQYTSVYDDENYKSALEYADNSQVKLYKAEAKALNEIQKGILEISQNEDPFDVFICYKETDSNGRRTPDSVLANDLYYQLTQEGFKVFFSRITLEDKIGSAYEPYIFAALNSAKVMVVLGTKPEYFNAVWVKNEWSRFLSLIKGGAKKALIPAYKDMDAYDLPDEFSHLQAQDMSKLGFMQDLLRGIRKLSESNASKKSTAAKSKPAEENKNSKNDKVEALLELAAMSLENGTSWETDEYIEKILEIDPRCAKAYLYQMMSCLCVKSIDELALWEEPLDERDDYKKFMRFASESERKEIEKIVKAQKDRINNIKNTENEKKYKEACEHLQKYNTYDLKVAWDTFTSLGNYKNSAVLAIRAKCQYNICNVDNDVSRGFDPLYYPIRASKKASIAGFILAIIAAGATVYTAMFSHPVLPIFTGLAAGGFLIMGFAKMFSAIDEKKRQTEHFNKHYKEFQTAISDIDKEIKKGNDVEALTEIRDFGERQCSFWFDENGKIKK